MSTIATGSCLCGEVKYETSADFEMAGNCHCNTCKKITGGPFEAFAIIDEKHIKLIQGKDSLSEYLISPKAKKHFCRVCGTPIFNLHKLAPGKLIIHIGSLDDPQSVTPVVNIHCEKMLPWVHSIKSIKSFDKGFTK